MVRFDLYFEEIMLVVVGGSGDFKVSKDIVEVIRLDVGGLG